MWLHFLKRNKEEGRERRMGGRRRRRGPEGERKDKKEIEEIKEKAAVMLENLKPGSQWASG